MNIIDIYLLRSYKSGIYTKGDGHCLPGSVFKGKKTLDLLPQFVSYVPLFKHTVDFIESNLSKYKEFLEDSEENSMKELHEYLNKRDYKLPSNINDSALCPS